VSISDIANFEQLWFIGDQPRLGPDVRVPINGYVGSRESPINSVDKVKTPTLFISGERDYRTPSPAGGEAMFRALKRFRVPTALIRFDTAGHSIFGSEYPMHSSLRIRYLLRWMNLHLRGVPAPEFDVVPTLSDSESAASGR
jgi:dipeptidyl aminopeptidase/acylaminoacyl peptidase